MLALSIPCRGSLNSYPRTNARLGLSFACAGIMAEVGCHHLPVLDKQKILIAVITMSELLRIWERDAPSDPSFVGDILVRLSKPRRS
jgi:hypothetical protein